MTKDFIKGLTEHSKNKSTVHLTKDLTKKKLTENSKVQLKRNLTKDLTNGLM